MTLPIIALIVALIALVTNIAIIIIKYKHVKASDDYSIDDNPYNSKYQLYSLQNKITRIEFNVSPLVKRYEEEQQEKLMETRKTHWKSFNKWKMQKGMMNQDAGDRPICGACFNDSLELNIEYKTVEGEPYYTSWGDVVHLESKKDYPLSAEQKCTICGHVADKWEYEEC